MKLGFYYHSNYVINSGKIVVPGYIGVFIDSLAASVTELTLFLEKQSDPNSTEEDYELKHSNIKLVSLGEKSSFYHRLLFYHPKLNIFKANIHELDALLIRVPSPLMPPVYFRLKSKLPVIPFVVGNYMKGLWSLEQPFVRKIGVVLINYYYQLLHNKMIKNAQIFVNSKELYQDNVHYAKQTTLVKTTTLTQADFYKRENTCEGNEIHILYTGRINYQKGLRELIESIAYLKNDYQLHLDIVGWEEGTSFNYEKGLLQLALDLNISDRIHFHGKKELGEALNSFYRSADIYAIPSYHEGFPRTIWEAMANSLPVIATTVGSIPHYLKSEENCLLIPPRNSNELAKSIIRIINDKELRKKLVENGYKLAQEATLEKQTQILISKIAEYITNE